MLQYSESDSLNTSQSEFSSYIGGRSYHSSRRDKGKDQAQTNLLCPRDSLSGSCSDDSTKCESLKHLVDEDNSEQCQEVRILSNNKRQSNHCATISKDAEMFAVECFATY